MIKRRIIIGLIVLAVIIFILFNPFFGLVTRNRAASNAAINLPASISANSSENITIPVIVNTDGQSVAGVDVSLTFDATVLALASLTPNSQVQSSQLKTFLPVTSAGVFDTSGIISKANSSGKLEFSAVNFDQTTNQVMNTTVLNTFLATAVFTPLKTGTTTISVDFTDGATTDSNIVLSQTTPLDILAKVQNSTVTISGTLPSAAPTSSSSTPTTVPSVLPTSGTPLPTAANCSRHAQGDSNCDGRIRLFDIQMWLDVFIKGGYDSKVDFNNDNKVNLFDAQTWQDWYLKENTI